MKRDLSLGDLKKQKKQKNFFIKKSSQTDFEFFDIEAPYETRTSLFSSPLVY